MITLLPLLLALQLPDTTCQRVARVATDSLAKVHLTSTHLTQYQVRAIRTLDSLHTDKCVLAGPVATVSYTITVRQPDSTLAIPPGVPSQTAVRITVDSSGTVVSDSAGLAIAPALVSGAWDASVRRWRLTNPTTPGSVTLTWTYRGASTTSPLTITGQPDTTTPPPPDTTTPPPSAGVALPRSVPVWPSGLASAACTRAVTGSGLQQAVNAATGGDVLCLTPGDRFRGTLTLPVRADTGWVVLRTAPIAGQPPPLPGTRVRPSQSGLLAQLATTAGGGAATVKAAPGARGWYLALLEVTIDPAVTALLGTVIDLPRRASHVTLDRVLVRAGPTQGVQRCIALNASHVAVVDSWLDECHAKGFDSQAIVSWESDGPVLLRNNTLAGAGENIMLGGADPSVAGVVPQDWTITGNHIVTPISWKGVWTKKNLFETKNARRILVEGNVFEGSWTDGQVGNAFVLKTANQSGGCTWCSTNDVTITRNLILRAAGAFGITGREGGNSNPLDSLLRRMSITENYADSIGAGAYTGSQQLLTIMQGAADVTVEGNTLVGSAIKNDLSVAQPPKTAAVRFTFRNNALTRGQYPLHGCGSPITDCLPGAALANSWLIGAAVSGLPVGIGTVPTLADALARGAGISRATIDAAVRGVVVSP